MADVRITRRRGRKLWVPYSGFRWPPPRLVQLLGVVACTRGHRWSPWRRETEDWFEYVDGPLPWAWRICDRCGLSEHVREQGA